MILEGWGVWITCFLLVFLRNRFVGAGAHPLPAPTYSRRVNLRSSIFTERVAVDGTDLTLKEVPGKHSRVPFF